MTTKDREVEAELSALLVRVDELRRQLAADGVEATEAQATYGEPTSESGTRRDE